MDEHDYCNAIPSRMRFAILKWVCIGVVPGSFLRAIISHDLFGAFATADGENEHLVKNYVVLFHCVLPSPCHGTAELVKNWSDTRISRPLPLHAVEWPASWAAEVAAFGLEYKHLINPDIHKKGH